MIITTLINKYESVLDLFSFTPLPRFQGRETVSSRGVLGTFLLFVTMIVYISMTSQRFLSMTPSVSMNQSPTSAEPVQFLESGITFRINDAFNVPRQFFFNASYFQYYMAVTNVFQQDMEPREITPIKVVPCNLQWAGLLGSNSYCPETTPMLLGRYQSESYTFFRIDVVMCSPAFPFYNQTTGEVIPCEDMTTIMDTLARGRFNFLVNRPPTIPKTHHRCGMRRFMSLIRPCGRSTRVHIQRCLCHGALTIFQLFLPLRARILSKSMKSIYSVRRPHHLSADSMS